MKNLRLLFVLVTLTVCSFGQLQETIAPSQSPSPLTRACKKIVIVQAGCLLCGSVLGTGACYCTPGAVCYTGYGYESITLNGTCSNGNCGASACGLTMPQFKAKRAQNSYWLKSTTFPSTLSEFPIVQRAVEETQKSLMQSNVSACALSNNIVVMRNKDNPSDPIYAELKDYGNGYRLEIHLESDKSPRWVLHIVPENWSLESDTKQVLLTGTY